MFVGDPTNTLLKPDADLQARVELLRSPSTSVTGAPEVESPAQPAAPAPAVSAHGYNDIAIAAQATRAIAEIGSQAPTNGDDYIHPDLRTRNDAALTQAMMVTNSPGPAPAPAPVQAPMTGHSPVAQTQQIPTALAAMASMAPIPSPIPVSLPAPIQAAPPQLQDPMATDGRKTKRELSQSKRAAQNRAAQVCLTFLFFFVFFFLFLAFITNLCHSQ